MTASSSKRLTASAVLSGAVLLSLLDVGAASAQSRPMVLVPPPPAAAASEPVKPSATPALPFDRAGGKDVLVQDLQAVDPSSGGVLDETRGGFGIDMWSGTDIALVQKVMPTLPAAATSRTMRSLTRRLLLSIAAVPQGPEGQPVRVSAGASLLKLRAERLMAMGDLDGLLALLRAVPGNAVTPDLLRLRIDALLLLNDAPNACETLNAVRGSDVYFAKVQIFCQLLAEKRNEAGLGLDLLSEQGHSDAAFSAAADTMLGHLAAAVDSLPKPTALQMAALRAARRPLPADASSTSEPAILRAIAGSPNAPVETRLLAAEKAEAVGALDTESLRQLYGNTTFSDQELQAPLSQAAADRGGRNRALLYRAAQLQTTPVARAEVMARAFSLARDRGHYFTAARLYGPLIQQLKPAPDLGWFAAHASRALFAAGRGDLAKPWVTLARQHAASVPDALNTATALAPLVRLSEPDEGKPRPPGALANWRKARPDLPPEQAERRNVLLLSLLDALGDSVATDDWIPLMDGPPTVTVTIPRPALWHALRIAAEDLRLAETIMLAMVSLGDAGPAAAEPTSLYRVVASLRLVGLDQEARALAVEAAIANGL